MTQPGTPNWVGNSSFSARSPRLQLVVDSTSLGEFKLCPRRYYYSIVLGWQPRGTSPHLDFGIWLHGGAERYYKARAAGQDHDAALRLALKWVLVQTWDKTLGRPWLSGHPAKNRLSLARTLVWLLDEHQDDPLALVHLPHGPGVELSGQLELPLRSQAGEAFALCWHMDRLVTMNGTPYVVDIKTTSRALDQRFFQSYSPDNQMSLYSLAARVAYEVPAEGVIIEGCQVGATFSRFTRGLVARTSAQLDEWLGQTQWWISQMEASALAGEWPMNDKSCSGPYGDCPFRPVCARNPSARSQWLDTDYQRRQWDPARARGLDGEPGL